MDLEKLARNFAGLWKSLIGGEVPQYVITTATVVAAILALLFLIARVAREIKPLFYDAAERRRVRRRRRFAEHVRREIGRIDHAADWSGQQYAELEAEVEAEGGRRSWLRFRRRPTLRRERSLSRALRGSRERLILLEGEPGAGKSVALRHLTVAMAAAAARSRSAKSIVPLYVDLKTLRRPANHAVDAELIREHVLKTLTRANSRDVQEFLDGEFSRGLEEGTWLFLFDSFDEIPEVLSATSADTSIRDYAEAIDTFLTSMNACRGIVASRHFRGPGSLGWPRFRILALSDERRRRLIRRAGLPPHVEHELIGQLELADPALAVTSRNPLFLRLLCQHMSRGNPFPDNAHLVFENFIETRLRRDEEKLRQRFGIDSVVVRKAAEQAAFCMADHPALGLSPTREALAAAMRERGFDGDPMLLFDALELVKLAEGDTTFTFTHRRFQEYFATSVVLGAPDAVTPERLLTDARWRETAVVLLQTRTGEQLDRIVAKIGDLLEREAAAIEGGLLWPPLALHLLSLLQSGYQGRASAAPPPLRELVGRIVQRVTESGTLADRKWALEVAGIAPEPVLMQAIRDAFSGPSRWLAEVAYRQAALLGSVPPDIARAIRLRLFHAFLAGRLRRERHATLAHLRRLPQHEQFVHSARLLLIVVPVDLVLRAFIFAKALAQGESWLNPGAFTIAFAAATVAPYLVGRFPDASAEGGILLIFLTHFPCAFMVATLVSESFLSTLILAMWAGCAIAAAATGHLTAPRRWPLLSLFPIVILSRDTRLVERGGNILLLAFGGTAVLVIGAMVVLSITGPPSAASMDTAGNIIHILMGVWGAGVILQLSAGSIRDYVLWSRKVRHVQRFAHAGDVAAQLREFRTPHRQIRFVEWVTQKSMLEPTDENASSVRQLAIDLEKDVRAAGVVDALNILAERLRARGTPTMRGDETLVRRPRAIDDASARP